MGFNLGVKGLNPSVTPDGWSYVHCKRPRLHPCRTALSMVGREELHLTGQWHPIQPIKVRGTIYVDYTYG